MKEILTHYTSILQLPLLVISVYYLLNAAILLEKNS